MNVGVKTTELEINICHIQSTDEGVSTVGTAQVLTAGVLSPGVARFLRCAQLQLLHQHLAAPPQCLSEFTEGAAAAQGPITILKAEEEEEERTAISLLWSVTCQV